MGRKKNEGSAGAGRICFSTIKVLFYCTVPVQEAFLIFTCVVLFLLSLSLFVVVVAIFILVHHTVEIQNYSMTVAPSGSSHSTSPLALFS